MIENPYNPNPSTVDSLLRQRQTRVDLGREQGLIPPLEPTPQPESLEQHAVKKFFGNEIAPEDKSFLRKVGEDAALLAYGIPVGLARVATGLVTHPIQTAKELGGGLVQAAKDVIDPEFYKAHPLLGVVNLAGFVMPIAGIAKSVALKTATKTALNIGIKEAINLGIEETVARDALTVGLKEAGGLTLKKGVFGEAVYQAAKTGKVEIVSEVVKNLLSKSGVADDIALRIATEVSNNLYTTFSRQTTKMKVLETLTHPVEATAKFLTGKTDPIRKAIFGSPAETAVAKLYGVETVAKNPEGFVAIERWAAAQLKEQGLENSVANRQRVMQNWVEQNSEWASLTPEERVAHFRNYAESDLTRLKIHEATGIDIVTVKALPQNYVDAMVATLKEAPADLDVPALMKLMEETYGRDFTNHSAELAVTLAKNNTKEAMINVVSKLGDSRATISFAKFSKEVQTLADELEKTGYRIGHAPTKKDVSFAADIIGEVGRKAELPSGMLRAGAISKRLKEQGYTGQEISDALAKSISKEVTGVQQYNTQEVISNLPTKIAKIVPITRERFTALIEHIKKNGGITADFNGNIKTKGFAFSVLDKADEVRIKVTDVSFDKSFIKTFNSMKEKYSSQAGVGFGGWIDGEDFVIDLTKVGDSMLESIYEGIIKKQDAIGDIGKYIKGEDGTIFITKEIIASLQPISGASLRSSKSVFRNWEEIVSYYTEKNFKNSIAYEELLRAEIKRGVRDTLHPDLVSRNGEAVRQAQDGGGITVGSALTKRTAFGNWLDRLGLSPSGVIEGAAEFSYRENFTQGILGDFAKKYGNVIKAKSISSAGQVSIPVEKLYEWLDKNKAVIRGVREKYTLPVRTVFDLKEADLIRAGFTKEIAADIVDVSKKALFEVPTSVTGMGDKVVNFLRTRNKGYNAWMSNIYDTYLKAAYKGRYDLSPFFSAQEFVETKLNSALFLKDASLLAGGRTIQKLGAWTAEKLSNYIGKNTATYLRQIVEQPPLTAVVAVRDEILGTLQKTMLDYTSSPDIIGIQNAAKGLGGLASEAAFEQSIKSRNLWYSITGQSSVRMATTFNKALAAKFGMTLEDALAFTVNEAGRKVYKNPQMLQIMREATQEIFHYKPGLLTSPLVKTMNIVWFPFRFQAKTISLVSKWMSGLSPASKLVVMNNWTHFANWAGTDEGIEWRRTNRNMLYNIFSYVTAYEQIGQGIEAVTKGRLFGGNAGLVGGVPFGFFVNLARELAILPEDPDQFDPKTGRRFTKEIPREIISAATLANSIEQLLISISPSTPFYSLTGGVIAGVSPRKIYESLVRQVVGAGKAAIEGREPARGRQILERDFKRVPLEFSRLAK